MIYSVLFGDSMSQNVKNMLKEMVSNAPVVRLGNYGYLAIPITNGINLEPHVIDNVANSVLKKTNRRFNKILVPESPAVPIATAMSLKAQRRLVIARKLQLNLTNEIVAPYKTGFERGTYFINGLANRDSVLLFDDVVSTGGTMIALIRGLAGANVTIQDVVAVIDRNGGSERVEHATGYKVKSLMKIKYKQHQPEILNFSEK